MILRSRLLAQAVAQVVSVLNPYQAHRLLHAHLEPQWLHFLPIKEL
jgi:hypothetical protein